MHSLAGCLTPFYVTRVSISGFRSCVEAIRRTTRITGCHWYVLLLTDLQHALLQNGTVNHENRLHSFVHHSSKFLGFAANSPLEYPPENAGNWLYGCPQGCQKVLKHYYKYKTKQTNKKHSSPLHYLDKQTKGRILHLISLSLSLF